MDNLKTKGGIMSKLDKQVDSLPFGLHEVKAKGNGNCDICGDFR